METRKKIILITGMFTSGKSTLAENIINENDGIFIIPQATLRLKRDDDDLNFFTYYNSKDEYYNQRFFSCYGEYGILEKDIVDFFNSKNNNAVGIVSTFDIYDFIKKVPRHNLHLILKTLTSSLEEEKKEIDKRFPLFFEGKTLEKRISLAKELAEDYYFNDEYSSQFDVIIPISKGDIEYTVNDVIISTENNSNVKRGNARCRKI